MRAYLIAWLDLFTNDVTGFSIVSQPNVNASFSRYPVIVLDTRETGSSTAREKLFRAIRDDVLLMENNHIQKLLENEAAPNAAKDAE